MEKKYFFFDIDGTLTDRSTGKIVPSAREALDRLEANGHFVAIYLSMFRQYQKRNISFPLLSTPYKLLS